MKSWFRAAAAAIVCLAAVAAANGAAHADNYPSRTITIIVPASPGGVTDMLGRILAQHMIADWGAQVVVENKPGANNQIAAEYVTHQPGDGYTLFIGPETTFVVNPTLYPHLAYDPVKGFTPITGLVQINHALILNPAVPANSVKELIALDKAKPGQLNYGTFGVGSSGHLNMEMFKSMTGTKFVAVHYKGAAPAMQDVLADHIQLMFVSVGSALPQVKCRRRETDRHRRAQAHGAVAGCSGDRRDGAGLYRGVVVRALRPARHAERSRRQDQQRSAEDLRRSGREEKLPRQAIFRLDRRLAQGA